jgi:hypothetical protein
VYIIFCSIRIKGFINNYFSFLLIKKKKLFFFSNSWVFFIFCCFYLGVDLFFDIGIVGVRAKMGDRVLDLCCGSGDLAFLLSEKVGSNGKVCSNTTIVVI